MLVLDDEAAVFECARDAKSESRPDMIASVDVRRGILRDLGPAKFTPRPWRALWFIPCFTIAAASIALVIVMHPSWYGALALALVTGQCIAGMSFLAHEALHGSMVSSTRMQTFLGYLGFGPLGVSPALWRVWHNQVHHGNTNMGNADPDSFGTLKRYRIKHLARFVARLAPGSRHWSSAFFLAYWFSFHAQSLLWLQSKHMRSFASLDRRRAKLDTLGSVALWAVIAFIAGWDSLYVIVIPLVTANATVMSYIATNHFMRPQSGTNDPLENSMSVTTWPLIDRIHFNFSHHVEHHLFPRMSPASAPAVRAWLRTHASQRYVSPPHLAALAALYRTPRIYLDTETLCDPENLDHTVHTGEIAAAFAANGA